VVEYAKNAGIWRNLAIFDAMAAKSSAGDYSKPPGN
jgi:hypothetical protein